MRYISMVFLFLTAQIVCGQTDMRETILGKWKFVSKKTTAATENKVGHTTAKDVFLSKNIILRFRDSASLAFEPDEASVSLIVSYGIKDSILSIVDHTYRILKMDKHVLHFKRTDSLQTTYQYERIKR